MIWIISAFCAFFVKGLCGFANTLVFTSILSFQINNIDISPIDVLLGCPSNVIIAWKERKHIDWKLCLPIIGLILLGSFPGMFLLKNTDTTIIKIVFGFVVIGIGFEMLLRNNDKPASKYVLVIIGVLSGLLCGLFGIGALLSAYLSRVTKDTHSFRANMCMVFTVENIFRIICYIFLGIITLDAIKTTLLVIPFMFFGLYSGLFVSQHMKEKGIKKIVIIMLILSGVVLVWKSL